MIITVPQIEDGADASYDTECSFFDAVESAKEKIGAASVGRSYYYLAEETDAVYRLTAHEQDKDWNVFSDLDPQSKPDIGECWEVNYVDFTMDYRSEQQAKEAAIRHKSKFGGIGGEYDRMGWYPVRELTESL